MYQKISEVTKNKWNLANLTINDKFIILINGTQDEFQNIVYNILQKYIVNLLRNDKSNI